MFHGIVLTGGMAEISMIIQDQILRFRLILFSLSWNYLRKFSFNASLLSLWSEMVKMVMSWASTINYSSLAKARNATFLDGSTEHFGCQQNLVFICRKRTASLTCSGLQDMLVHSCRKENVNHEGKGSDKTREERTWRAEGEAGQERGGRTR
jgi:hypothetical protein